MGGIRGKRPLPAGRVKWCGEPSPRTGKNKGTLVQQILRAKRIKRGVLFVGDDRTDEDVFKVLKKRGVGIQLGKDRLLQASYYLKK